MNIYQEIALFFDEPIEQVKGKCSQAHFRLNRLWREVNPQSERHRNLWYKTTDAHIYEGANWHQGHIDLRRKIAKRAYGKILCFGAGIGTEGILAAQMGKDVTFYELPGLIYEFLKFRVALRGLKVKFIAKELREVKRDSKIYYRGEGFEQYDTIICIDVLEHLAYPQEVLNFLGRHLKQNGLFLISAPFNRLEYVGHLPQHRGLNLNQMMGKAEIKNYQLNILEEKNQGDIFSRIRNSLLELFFGLKFLLKG